MTLRRGAVMGGGGKDAGERAYPADTGATEDAVHAPHSAAPRHKASF
jgi:hypothetical protein